MNRRGASTAPPAPEATRGPLLRTLLLGALALAFAGFVALGIWQLQRMAWKHDLVQRVESRIHAAPGDIPDAARWATVDAESDEYRRVRVAGRYLDVAAARVQAVTDLGPGWWLLSPLETSGGAIVLVNRGYLATGDEAPAPPTGPATVTGLLRLTEPGGGFLRENRPVEDRWYSRDVAAIAAARSLPTDRVAPFFIDADAATSPGPHGGTPVGGLTVVKFRDPHLVYALTWFGMALLTVAAGTALIVFERRLRHHRRRPGPETVDADPSAGP